MKCAKKAIVLLLSLTMVMSCLCMPVAAEGDQPGGPGAGGFGGPGGFGGGDEEEGLPTGTYSYGDEENGMVLELKDDKKFTLTYADTTVNGTYESTSKISPFGKSTVVTFDENSVNTLKDNFPWYWKGSVSLKDSAFKPDADTSMAQVDYTYQTTADSNSVTGYVTTITVEDDGYDSVYAYGSWMASSMDQISETEYDSALYAPEEWENGMYYSGESAIAMTLDEANGVWTLTLPLASSNMGVQCYHDLADPSDVSGERITDENKFPIPYDAEKQSDSFNWTPTFNNGNPAGTLDRDVVVNTESGEALSLSVYTPNGYDPDRETPYPVLYLVPGGGTTYTTWFDGGMIHNIFDNLIAEGKVEPTILVSMELGSARGGSASNLIVDIIPYIEANYNASTDAADRAVVGTSMGGAAVTNIWLDEASNGLFSYYGFFSGADPVFKGGAYEASAEDLEMLGSAVIAIGGGTTDFNMFAGDGNSASIYELNQWMNDNGIEHSYAVVGGGHSWTTWTQLILPFAEELWQKEASADPTPSDPDDKDNEENDGNKNDEVVDNKEDNTDNKNDEVVDNKEENTDNKNDEVIDNKEENTDNKNDEVIDNKEENNTNNTNTTKEPAEKTNSSKTKSPKTGDESIIMIYMIALLAAAAAAVRVMGFRKKYK